MSTPYGGNRRQPWNQGYGAGSQPRGGSTPPQFPSSGAYPEQYRGYQPAGQPGYQPANRNQFDDDDKPSREDIFAGRRRLAVAIAALVVLIAVFSVTAYWKPGFLVENVFDTTAQENTIKDVLTNSFKIPGVSDVTCPEEQPVTANTTFECIANIAGQPRKVPITVKDDSGAYDIGAPQ